MFNQARLELVPSIKLAGLITVPCLASLMLIMLADIPSLATLLLVLLHTFISYKCISTYGLLKSPTSITIIELHNKDIYLEDVQGNRYLGKLMSKSFIFPAFCLLSFDCKHLSQKESSSNKNSNDNIFMPSVFSKYIDRFRRFRIFLKPRRHLFICRYNAHNLNAYRRLRVWFKFS